MELEAISQDLKALFAKRARLSSLDELSDWNAMAAALVEHIDPSQAQAMRGLATRFALPLSTRTLGSAWNGVQQIVRDVIAKLDQGLYDKRPTMASRTPRSPSTESPMAPTLQVSSEDAKGKLSARIVEGERILERLNSLRSGTDLDDVRRDRQGWDEYNQTLLATVFQGGTFQDQYKRRTGPVAGLIAHDDLMGQLNAVRSFVSDRTSNLRSIRDQVDLCQQLATAPRVAGERTAADRVIHLCKRFPAIARQLKTRHGQREPLLIADEYDLQDVFRALLQIDFTDVRAEEWTPSYAGTSSRMDFLLKQECVVLETKKTREGLATVRQVADELIIDIARYQTHASCSALVCFVYDPDRRISNPAALENDLSKRHDSLNVNVIVAPHD